MVLARPIVDLLFLHGSFTAADAERAAGVVLYYGAGLWCFCANQVQVRAFYARKDTLSPVKVSAAMVLLNLVLTVALVGPLRERAVALANSATGLASFVALNVLLRHRHGDVRLASLAGMALRCTLAAAGMAAAARGTWRLTASWGEATIAAKAARALVPVAAGVASYALLAALLRIDEARLLLRRRHADR
jgi:putative peptidoglycan lipid II flippase